MKKKISESIQAKTFLSMLALLLACCIIIYAVVMVFLPKNYQTELESQATSDFYRLMETLERSGWEEGSEEILAFSMKNNATVRITDTDGSDVFSVNYADPENWEETDRTMSCSATFQEGWQTYQVSADISLVAVSQSYEILLMLIPLIAVVILLISVLAALVCSRYFSRPLIHICSVAKRMTSLDMTWKCEVKQRDEIGVLADSLNELSERLNNALVSLQDANEQLHKDIEREREQEKQRIDFFTAVSHELKTPIAIIKGELEGMIYQVGEYKDRDAYLRHCMKTVNDMERIVKDILSAARMGGSDFKLERTDLDIAVFNTKSASVGVGIQAVQVAQYAAAGMEFEQLKRLTAQLIEDTTAMFSIDTLEYLRRGGRIGQVTAIAGALLQIKPILMFDKEGVITTAAKIRGRAAVQAKLL